MAIEILTTYVAHDFSHDLESFFWLLLWVVLRYTKTTCWPAYRQYLATFGGQTEEQSAKDKMFFLMRPMEWEVVGNAPLTELVRNFKMLCSYKALPDYMFPEKKAVPLTYESVMALFDDSLARADWPQNDHALPFKMPSKTPAPSVGGSQPATGAGSRGGGKRREVSDESDPLSLPPHKRAHIWRAPADDSSSEQDD